MRVYHGSNTIFSGFDQGRSRIINDYYGGGVAYFTDNLEVAKSYARSMHRSKGGDMIVYEVNLSLKKVFDVDHIFTGKELMKFFHGKKEAEEFARGAGLLKVGTDKYTILGKLETGNLEMTGAQVFRGLSRGMVNTAHARLLLVDLGYDGLRYNGGLNMNMATKHSVYLAYKASVITIMKRYRIQQKQPAKMVAETLYTIKSIVRKFLKEEKML